MKMTLDQARECLRNTKVFIEKSENLDLIRIKLKDLNFDEGKVKDDSLFIICDNDGFYGTSDLLTFESCENIFIAARDILSIEIFEPKFKIGDTVSFILVPGEKAVGIISDIHMESEEYEIHYTVNGDGCYSIRNESEIKLYPKQKFKPFDKVLVRDNDEYNWSCALFSHYVDFKELPYVVCPGMHFEQCVPYEGNEEIVGTNNKPIIE